MAWKRGTLRSTSSRGVSLLLAGGLLHLDAVLVGAGEEEDVVAVEPHEAGDRVGRDRLVGVADMRHAVGIGDRGGEVIVGLVGHLRECSSKIKDVDGREEARPRQVSPRYQSGVGGASFDGRRCYRIKGLRTVKSAKRPKVPIRGPQFAHGMLPA